MQQHQYRARYYLGGRTSGDKTSDDSSAYSLPHEKISFYLNIGLLLAAIPVITTVIMGFVFHLSPEDVAQKFIVFTGRLTRDMKHPNGYPVTLSNGTEYTRLYYCMMDSGIGSDKCGSSSPVFDFTNCIQAVHNCNPAVDRTWPRDYGFLSCLQSNFNVSMRQTNVFLTCLDSSEGVMTEVFENMDSTTFLGSYNYVSLLLTALAIMSSFVVATAGGIYRGNPIAVNRLRHIKGINPFSWGCILVALVWNLVGLLWSAITNLVKTSTFEHYPLTSWTMALTVSMFALASGFFLTYFVDYFASWAPNEIDAKTQKAARTATDTGKTAGPMNQAYLPANSFRPRYPVHQRIGVENIDPLVADSATDYDWRIITPLMVRTFGWCWVFTDGLLFLGMLQPQSSIINSYAIRVFFGVIIARLMQLVSSYFANMAYINRSVDAERWSNETDPREFGAHMVTIIAYLASVPVLIDSLYHSAWALSYADEAVTGVAAKNTIILFIIIVGVLPEVCRMSLLLWVSFSKPEVGDVLFAHEFIFLWDWVARAIVIVIAIVTASANLHDADADLKAFSLMFV